MSGSAWRRPGRARGRRWSGGVWLPAMAALCIVAAAGLARAAAGPPPDQRALDDQVREIALGLRCVVCQNLSVADSPSDLAKEMRNLIRDLVQQGKTPQEIRDYFVSRYGEFVLLAPPAHGFSLLVWVLPFLALALGAGGVYLVARRWASHPATAPPGTDPAYLERVRRELHEREDGAA
jgi:cytochrome c-type biogenesis protein CcmH